MTRLNHCLAQVGELVIGWMVDLGHGWGHRFHHLPPASEEPPEEVVMVSLSQTLAVLHHWWIRGSSW